MKCSRCVYLLVIGLFFALLVPLCVAGSDRNEASPRLEFYGKLPLAFEPNVGQSRNHAEFLTRGPGLSIFFGKQAVEFVPGQAQHPVTLRFKHGNADPTMGGDQLLPGHTNYLIGNDRARWHTDVPNYQRVRYKGIYDGIDLVFYGNQQYLEHDFVVAPGADPGQIQLGIEGATRVQRRRDGSLLVQTAGGHLVFEKPVAYQESEHGRTEVAASFRLHGNDLAFRLGSYDRRRPLIIDPVLVYSTYLMGPNGGGQVIKIAVDASGNAYIAGQTAATDFPITTGAFQTVCNGCPTLLDVFVTKLNATGSALVYSTYLGGSGSDLANGIAVDGNGNAIVGGQTNTNDFPTQPPVTPSFPPGSLHGYVASLNAAGNALNWSQYTGGTTGNEEVSAVAVDSGNNAYASGVTNSSDFPITPGTLSSTPPAPPVLDIFALKFSSTGTKIFSAIIGHNGVGSPPAVNVQFPSSIAVDAASEPVIAGQATTGLPTTAGAFQTAPHLAGATNAFALKLNSDASALVFGTYLGGSGPDAAAGVALDATGNIYLGGNVGFSDFPTTPGAFQTTNCCGAFVAKLDPTGAHLLYSTFLSTGRSFVFTTASSIAVDGSGNAYLAGDTNDPLLPLVHPLKSTTAVLGFNARTAFVSKFDSTGSNLLFSSFFSGNTNTEGASLALGPGNFIFLTGNTSDFDLPVTPGAFETSPPAVSVLTGFSGPFIAKIDAVTPAGSLCMNPNFLIFPSIRVGQSAAPMSTTVTNCGDANLVFSSIVIDPGPFQSAFQITTNTCNVTLAPGASCTLTVGFAPLVNGPANANITLSSNASIAVRKFVVAGFGVAPLLTLPPSVVFDQALVGTTLHRSVVVQNAGQLVVNVSNVAVNGTDFALASHNCSAVAVGANCSVDVSFTPTGPGTLTGSLVVTSDAQGSPQTVPLSGTGVTSYPVPGPVSLSPQTILAGSAPTLLTVSGSNFFPASVIRVNGVAHATTYVSGSSLTTTLNASEIASMSEDSVTVFNPAPGGGESAPLPVIVYVSIPLAANNIVYEPFTQKIYAASTIVPAFASSGVLPIDPFTLQVGAPITIGNGPNVMAVSGDGQFLYAGLDPDNTLGRLDLYSQKPGTASGLGTDPISGTHLRAFDIEPVPGDPHVAAVSVRGGAQAGVDLIRDGILTSRLGNSAPDNVSVDSIAFAGNPGTFFGSDGSGYYTFTIGAGGLTASRTQLNITGTPLGRFSSDGTRFFTTSGRILDPATGTITGNFSQFANFATQAVAVVPNTEIGRVFFLNSAGTVAGFDSATLLPTAQIAFPQQGTPAQMFRWGNDGFAIQFTEPSDINFANNRLILFRGTPARVAATSLVPAISGLVPASTAATGLNFLLTINGSNFVPGAFVQWNGLQRSTTFVSATQLIAKIPGTDIQGAGSAQITVVNPGPVTSVASAFTITAGTAPFVALSALGLNFGNQQVGTTSAPQSVTLKNAGNASLNVSAIAITSPFTTSSYKQTNNCPVSLGGGASCQISVTFSPAGTGAPFESLTITDSATGSPHQVGLVGTGIDFFVSPFRGGSTVTVNSGETATYSVSASASPGFSGVISFACSGAPTGAACTVNPTAVSLGIAPVNFTVTVTTSPRAALTGAPTVFLAGAGWLMLLALAPLLFCFFRWSWFMGLRRRRVFALGVLASMLVLGVVACGGGGGGGSAGTPAGTYTIVLNSTSGAVTHQTQLTLIVR